MVRIGKTFKKGDSVEFFFCFVVEVFGVEGALGVEGPFGVAGVLGV